MRCLYCDREATVQEEYQGIPLMVCDEGHRTSYIIEVEEMFKEAI